MSTELLKEKWERREKEKETKKDRGGGERGVLFFCTAVQVISNSLKIISSTR